MVPHFPPSDSLLVCLRNGENGVRYSGPEKTILDFIYLWRYNGIPEKKIAADVGGLGALLKRS